MIKFLKNVKDVMLISQDRQIRNSVKIAGNFSTKNTEENLGEKKIMKTEAQRAEKRKKREDRKSKSEGWLCAGCKIRHPFGTSCPAPRLFARGFNRSGA